MRKTLLLFLLSLSCIWITAQTVSTTGTLSVSKTVSLAPGGVVDENEGYFTIAFEDVEEAYYTAYQMDIYLPDGYSFAIPEGWESCAALNENGGVYPKVNRKYVHTPALALRSANHLFVMVTDGSYANKAFVAHSGDLLEVYVEASPYAKPGDFQITVSGIKFVAPDETGYLYDDQILTAGTLSAESTLPLKITFANKISTAIFPFSCDVPEGLEVYTADGIDGEYLTLVQEDDITAFTPYILYAENGFDDTLNGTIETSNYPESAIVNDTYITGVLKDTEVAAGFVLQNKGEGPMFYRIGDTPFTIPAGKCYANPLPSGAAAIAIHFGDDDVNGIHSANASRSDSQTVYDLQGKQVLNPQSGHIYIIDGQKVLKR